MEKKNYITPNGYTKLKEELHNLVTKERPELVQVINWAASNGDRSENADYIYGKRRLREIDRKIHLLTRKIAHFEVVNYNLNKGNEKIFFGATVTIMRNNKIEATVKIVGQDEIDPKYNHISWTSPLAKMLLNKKIGDEFEFNSPSGIDEIEILNVIYE
ncbi:MAG: transcription elongation factor GreB [Neisseriaceae bacterium]